MRSYLDFEKQVADLEAKVEELRALSNGGDTASIGEELTKLEAKAAKALTELYANLTPWQKTQVARHPQRPHFVDYVKVSSPSSRRSLATAISATMAPFWAASAAFAASRSASLDRKRAPIPRAGSSTISAWRGRRVTARQCGSWNWPIASSCRSSRSSIPPAPFPGIDAEERGQAEAIARSTEASLGLGVPNVAVIVGEGGSGGAVAIASCNKVLMLEHAIYTVASPEASASILWRDAGRAEDAATGMKITAQDLLRFGIIDGIVPEPPGGAHRDPEKVIAATGEAVSGALAALGNMSREQIKSARAEKFLAMGRKL
jgi:acetyl-CoA carboxylase carboxyl transferase subunit alpha